MKFQIKTISLKKFMVVICFGMLFSVICGVSFSIYFENKYFMYLIILLFVITLYLAHRIALTISKIRIDENLIQINDQIIKFDNISGYFINNQGLTMTGFTLKLKSKLNVNITGLNYGKNGNQFRNFIQEFVAELKSKITSIEELNYQDTYLKQMKFLRPFIYFFIIVTIIIDLIILYFFLNGNSYLHPRVLLVNLTLLSLIPLLKKKKLIVSRQ